MSRPRFVIVLAANKREGYQYAHRIGLPPRQYRIPVRGAEVAGVRVADVHVLPSFKRVPQRHSILRALNMARGHGVDIRFMDVEMPPKAPAPIEDQGDGMGPQVTIDDLLTQAEDLADQAMEVAALGTPEDVLPPALDDKIVASAVRKVAEAVEAVENLDTRDGEDGETRKAREGEDAAPNPPRRRRSRCSECGELAFPGEHECPNVAPRERFENGFFS